MRKRMILGTALIAASIVFQAGCSATTSKDITKNQTTVDQNVEGNTEKQSDTEKKIMEEFNKLVEQGAKTENVVSFMDNNISKVSKNNASNIIVKFEEIQKKNIKDLEGKIFNEDVQRKFIEMHKPGVDINRVENIKDVELKELVSEVKDRGFKIETAEGMYFPVIDYEFYKKYGKYATIDIKDYIDVLAVESNNPPAKDAALIIGWDEIIKRGIMQEKFMDQSPDSKRIDDVKQLYKKYMTFALFGLNNTPLFDYDSKIINLEAKAAYLEAIKENNNSNMIKTIRDFMNLLEKNNYKLTSEVENFRKTAVN
jgi:hypothetical protein